jgi:inosose dehydratase
MQFWGGAELGVLAVPGDGMIDFVAASRELTGYSRWVVLEAEQDLKKASSLAYAKGRVTHLKAAFEESGMV